MARRHNDHFTGLHVAAEARKDARAGDHAYRLNGGERFSTGAVVNTDAVGVHGCKATVSTRVPAPHPPMKVLERDVLAAVLQAVAIHPAVAWAVRMNTGGVEREYKGETRYIAFSFSGCSDIIGQMKDGRFLAIECKRPGGKATAEQLAFLDRVHRAHGVAFVAWSVDDVMRGLAHA